jgi:ribosomal protein S18 acetylase RimI-like enzyme
MYPAYDTRVLLRPANLYALADLAQMWSLAYTGYFLELQFDEQKLDAHINVNDIDLARSIVIESDEREFIGLSLLAVRGARGWIGGFGIQPKYRRRGHSSVLIRSQLAVAHGAGLGSIQLEVLMQNWASKTYESAGFTHSRQLFILAGPITTTDAPTGVELVSARVALQQIQRLRCGRVWPWQREVVSIAKSLSPTAVGVVCNPDDGMTSALVCDRDGEKVRILDVAGSPSAVGVLLATVRDIYGEREAVLLNEPADSELHPYLLAAGLKAVWIQREMILQFDLAPYV